MFLALVGYLPSALPKLNFHNKENNKTIGRFFPVLCPSLSHPKNPMCNMVDRPSIGWREVGEGRREMEEESGKCDTKVPRYSGWCNLRLFFRVWRVSSRSKCCSSVLCTFWANSQVVGATFQRATSDLHLVAIGSHEPRTLYALATYTERANTSAAFVLEIVGNSTKGKAQIPQNLWQSKHVRELEAYFRSVQWRHGTCSMRWANRPG